MPRVCGAEWGWLYQHLCKTLTLMAGWWAWCRWMKSRRETWRTRTQGGVTRRGRPGSEGQGAWLIQFNEKAVVASYKEHLSLEYDKEEWVGGEKAGSCSGNGLGNVRCFILWGFSLYTVELNMNKIAQCMKLLQLWDGENEMGSREKNLKSRYSSSALYLGNVGWVSWPI